MTSEPTVKIDSDEAASPEFSPLSPCASLPNNSGEVEQRREDRAPSLQEGASKSRAGSELSDLTDLTVEDAIIGSFAADRATAEMDGVDTAHSSPAPSLGHKSPNNQEPSEGIAGPSVQGHRRTDDHMAKSGTSQEQPTEPEPVNGTLDSADHEKMDVDKKDTTLLEQALAAILGDAMSTGDVLIIVDMSDLSKSCRVKSSTLAKKAPKLPSAQDDTLEVMGVKTLLVIGDVKQDGVPALTSRALDTTGIDTTASSTNTTSAGKTKVKTESEANDGSNTDTKTTQLPTSHCWASSYLVLLRLLQRPEAFNDDIEEIPETARQALPVIESVIAIAKRYGATQHIRGHLRSMIPLRIHRGMLPGIAAQPVRWLNVFLNLDMQKYDRYEEAFTHVVGRYLDHNEDYDQLLLLPAEIQAQITSNARMLCFKRMDIDRKLMLLTLTARPPTAGTAQPVSNNSAPFIWELVNTWGDWLKAHIAWLDGTNSVYGAQHSSDFCDGKDCTTVAGLYRTIYRAGDAYVPVEDLLKTKWKRLRHVISPREEQAVRTSSNVYRMRDLS